MISCDILIPAREYSLSKKASNSTSRFSYFLIGILIEEIFLCRISRNFRNRKNIFLKCLIEVACTPRGIPTEEYTISSCEEFAIDRLAKIYKANIQIYCFSQPSIANICFHKKDFKRSTLQDQDILFKELRFSGHICFHFFFAKSSLRFFFKKKRKKHSIDHTKVFLYKEVIHLYRNIH